MKLNGYIVTFYALVVLGGGMMGFAKAHSLPSLIMGTAFGLGLLASGIGLLKNHKFGFIAAISLSAGLACFFTYRFLLSHSFMPAGLMAILSFLVVVILFTNRVSREKKEQDKAMMGL